MGMPWRGGVVRDRPVHPVAEPLGGDELVLAPALRRTSPDERLPADLIAADPVEGLLLYVRVVGVLHEEMRGVFAVTGRFADERICVDQLARVVPPVRQLPWGHVRRGVIFDVLYVAAALEHEGLEAVVAQLFRGPPAGDSGADDDGVVRAIGFGHAHKVSAPWRDGG